MPQLSITLLHSNPTSGSDVWAAQRPGPGARCLVNMKSIYRRWQESLFIVFVSVGAETLFGAYVTLSWVSPQMGIYNCRHFHIVMDSLPLIIISSRLTCFD